MLRAHGYGLIVDPDQPTALEFDTITCSHCQQVVRVKPGSGATQYLIQSRDGRWSEAEGAFCRVCMRPVCLRCCAVGRCLPWERRLERMEARQRLRRAVR